jgi:hypothetical protein
VLRFDERNHKQKIIIFFAKEPNMFMIKTITLLKPKICNVVVFGAKVGTENLTFNFPHFEGQI